MTKDQVKANLFDGRSKTEFGIWVVKGEDPNCDMQGIHIKPILGYFEGCLQNVIDMAVILPRFFSWGAGGSVEAITIQSCTSVTVKERVKLIQRQAELEQEKTNIDQELKRLDK